VVGLDALIIIKTKVHVAQFYLNHLWPQLLIIKHNNLGGVNFLCWRLAINLEWIRTIKPSYLFGFLLVLIRRVV